MKNKFKKAVFALALGISTGAWALPTASTCDSWCQQCVAAGDEECSRWYSGFCHTARGITCHPKGAFEL